MPETADGYEAVLDIDLATIPKCAEGRRREIDVMMFDGKGKDR
jgi:hypothetical protein